MSEKLNLYEVKYIVFQSNPIGDVKIHEGNPFGSNFNSVVNSMGYTKKDKNPFFKSTIKYPNKDHDKTLEFTYHSEFVVQSQLELQNLKSDNLKSLFTELCFRHQTHIHQFLQRQWEKSSDNFPFPPYTVTLLECKKFVKSSLNNTYEQNN